MNEFNLLDGLDDESLYDNKEFNISSPYNPDLINVATKQYTVFHIMKKIRQNTINLQPDFQRHIVWDETRQSRLIESILIRIPLPSFYLDARKETNWIVVDGLQRLSTLNNFINKNTLKLINLEFLTELNGKTFDELSIPFKTRIEDTHLTFNLIQPDTPNEVKFTIFYRINTSGMVLTGQEIRHSLYQGKSTELLKELSQTKEFINATGDSINPKRMADRECILRFISFYITPYINYTEANFDNFLNNTMEDLNKKSDADLETIASVFKATMNKANYIFGKYAFRKMYTKGGRKYPINKALFESWSVALTHYDKSILKTHKNEIVNQFVHLIQNDSEFEKSISQGTGSVSKVKQRFYKIEKLLDGIIR